jgi:hypothetical protein
MTTWIQYHNCDSLGYFPYDGSIDNIDPNSVDLSSFNINRCGIDTKKKKLAYDSIGNQIFLIIGIGKPKEYFLWTKIVADKVIPNNDGYFVVEGNCIFPKNPIRLDVLENFGDLKHFCGNFGIGFQNITKHPFSKVLNNLVVEYSDDAVLDDFIDIKKGFDNIIHELNQKMQGIHPTKINRLIEATIRKDSHIINVLKEINNFKCQFPGCNMIIPKRNGGYYVEVAHIKSVAKGGQSVIGNLLVLCPNHHKLIDYGKLEISIQTEKVLKGSLNGEKFEIKINYGTRKDDINN